RVLTDMQKEIAAKGQQSSANTLPNMPHHDVNDNSLTQKNRATVQEPQNIPLIHGETAANKRTYYKRVSEAKSTLENFETTMQKAQKALGIINKTPNSTAQTDKLQDKSQDEIKSVQSAQLIMNREKAQGDASLQMPLKEQKPIMRKEEINPQMQTVQELPQMQTLQNSQQMQLLQNLPQTQTVQNSQQMQLLQNLPQTQTLQKLSQTITAQNQNPINQNSSARNTALINKLFTYADFLRNTTQKPVLPKPQSMEMRKEQTPPQAQTMQNKGVAQSSNTAQNKSIAQSGNIAQNKSMAQSGNTAQNKSMAQSSNIAPNNTVAQNEALASRIFTSAEVLHNKAQKQIQEKTERADKSALPIVQNVKQREPVTTVNTAASQLVYPMA
ncbi:MAG: hypothetical protein RSC01_10640, partial [Oscillospiraceae bacterium]